MREAAVTSMRRHLMVQRVARQAGAQFLALGIQAVELRVGEAASVVLVHICGIKGELIEADHLAFEQPGVRLKSSPRHRETRRLECHRHALNGVYDFLLAMRRTCSAVSAFCVVFFPH